MADSRNEFEFPTVLKDVILSKKCVAYIGSGASADCYPSWLDLVNELCERCGSPVKLDWNSDEDEYLRAAQDAKNRDEEGYYNYLGECFGKSVNLTAPIYQVLLQLPFASYLTVNFDPLLAEASRFASLPCSSTIGVYPALDPRAMVSRSIHYLHGYIGQGQSPCENSIVLSKDEFESAYAPNSSLMTMLLPCFENDPIVFIGCRLREPTMREVIRICKGRQETRRRLIATNGLYASKPPPRFILRGEIAVFDEHGERNEEESARRMRKEEAFYRGFDIEPIWYPVADNDHSALRRMLEMIANIPQVEPTIGWDRSVYDR